MAEVLPELGGKVVYGDLLFALGLPIPIRSLAGLRRLAATMLPLLCHAPMSLLYPTGSSQDTSKPKHTKYFDEADIIAGDYVFIKRYAPPQMKGKVIVTNTTRASDVEDLRGRGVSRLITTTPPMGGESFGTNVLEGVIVTLTGKRLEDLTEQDYLNFAEQTKWEPGVVDL